MTSSNKKPIASAILATYNSEQTIVLAITSLLTQTVDIEIIVVDDGSTDQTKDILKNFPGVIYLSQKHLGPAHARNLGAKKASSSILMFVDADMSFDPNYVKDLIQPIINYRRAAAKPEMRSVGTYTINERVANWDNPLARCWNIQEGWADHLRFPALVDAASGTDYRAILKKEFDRVGGFDDVGYTDTWSLFNKLNVRPQKTRATCYHKNPDSFTAIYKQARWAAKRPYKYGLIGPLYALLRTSLPLSLIIGILKAIKHHNYYFIPFKIVYDFGRFVGIIEMLTTGKLSK